MGPVGSGYGVSGEAIPLANAVPGGAGANAMVVVAQYDAAAAEKMFRAFVEEPKSTPIREVLEFYSTPTTGPQYKDTGLYLPSQSADNRDGTPNYYTAYPNSEQTIYVDGQNVFNTNYATPYVPGDGAPTPMANLLEKALSNANVGNSKDPSDPAFDPTFSPAGQMGSGAMPVGSGPFVQDGYEWSVLDEIEYANAQSKNPTGPDGWVATPDNPVYNASDGTLERPELPRDAYGLLGPGYDYEATAAAQKALKQQIANADTTVTGDGFAARLRESLVEQSEEARQAAAAAAQNEFSQVGKQLSEEAKADLAAQWGDMQGGAGGGNSMGSGASGDWPEGGSGYQGGGGSSSGGYGGGSSSGGGASSGGYSGGSSSMPRGAARAEQQLSYSDDSYGSWGDGLAIPLAIDLDGDGLETIAFADSGARYDLDQDGFLEKTSWISGDDGWLAYDANQDGKIEGLAEISPAYWVEQTTGKQVSDWQGLAEYFDSNQDGVFDAKDDEFHKFGVWQDKNEDGKTDTGEFQSLDRWGIEGVSTSYGDYNVQHVNDPNNDALPDWLADDSTLTLGTAPIQLSPDSPLRDAFDVQAMTSLEESSAGVAVSLAGGAVTAGSLAAQTSGTSGSGPLVYDVVLGFAQGSGVAEGQLVGADGTVTDYHISEDGFIHANTDLDGDGQTDVTYFQGNQADNSLDIRGQQQDAIAFGAGGDDVLMTGAGDDLLHGSLGRDLLAGGGGQDVVLYSDSDVGVSIQLDRGDGFSAALGGDAEGDQLFDIEVISGSFLDDSISGDALDNVLIGAWGDDKLAGGAGDDRLIGGRGDDTLVGGAGQDTLVGGAGRDLLFGDSYGGVLVTPLSSYAASTDADGSEVLSVTISGLPEGAVLSAGTPVGGGVYVLALAELLDLQLITVGQLPSFELTVEVGVQEYDPVTRVASSTSSLRNITVNMPTIGAGNDILDGGDGNDHLFGEGGDDQLYGGQGDDVIDTGSGHNRVDAGIGNDTVLAYAGDDIIDTGLGNDEVWAGDGQNTVDLGDGDNYAEAGSGDDVIRAGLGFDTVLAGDGTNQIEIGDGGGHIASGSGDDQILGGDGFERVLAGDGDNIINLGDGGSEVATGSGDDRVTTARGDDVILAGAGGNRIASGAGADTIVTLGGADTIDSGEGDDSVNSGDGDDLVSLGAGHDLLLAGEGNNDIDGGGGDDALYAGSGDDRALGGTGNDWIDLGAGRNTIDAGEGNDTIVAVQGQDTIDAGAGDDTLYVDGSDTIQGGLGLDTAYFSGDSIHVDLAALGLEVVHATQGDDTLDARRTPVGMSLYGYAGDDELLGSAFADKLYGGDDDDSLDGGAGADILDGGVGDDSLRFDVSDTIHGGSGYDTATLTGDGDLIIDLHSVSIEKLISGAGQDVISSSGSTALNIDAGAGDDIISGSSANDILVGGAGQDRIDGGAGDDDITIDADDFLANVTGGSGHDLLRVSGDFDLSIDLDATSFEKLLSSSGDDIVYHAERGLDLDGGAGIDTLNYATLASGIEVDLAAGTTSLGGTLNRFENVVGTAHKDRLTGTSGDNIFTLKGGSDEVFGGDGFDIARLSGDLFDYSWSQQADGSWIVDNGVDSIHLDSIEQVEVGGHDIYLDGRNNAMIWTGQTSFDLIEDETSIFADSTVTDLVWDFDVNVLGTQNLDVVAVQGSYISGDANGANFSLLGDANYYGQTVANFQVSDGVDTSAWSDDFVVRVEGVNDAPVITGVVYTDGVYDANGVQGYVQVIEYDGDPVVFNWTSSAGTSGSSDGTTIGGLFQIDQGGNFILTPTAVAAGYRVVGWDFTMGTAGGGEYSFARLSYYLYEESSLSYVEVQVIATDPDGLSSAAMLLGQDTSSASSTYLGSYSEFWHENWGGTIVPSNKSQAVARVEADIAAKGAPPVVIDLDGDGLEIVPMADSRARFDIDGDGALEAMTWVAPDDGFLAFDANGDGLIESAEEIRFDGYHPDARTDMEGLRLAFDSNQDGQLTAADEQWDKFGVFQDLNGDGFCDPEEFRLLSKWGITAVGLTPSGELVFEEDYAVLGRSTVTFEDGSQTQVGDTILTYQELEIGTLDGANRSAAPAGAGLGTASDDGASVDGASVENARDEFARSALVADETSADEPDLRGRAPASSGARLINPATLEHEGLDLGDVTAAGALAGCGVPARGFENGFDVAGREDGASDKSEIADAETAELAGCLDLLAANMATVSPQSHVEPSAITLPGWVTAGTLLDDELPDGETIAFIM